MEDKIVKTQEKITKIKKEMMAIGPMRPGSLTVQARRNKGNPYGEYWQLSYTFNKKGHTEYIPPELLKDVRAEIDNYQKFKDLLESLVGLSIDLSKTKTDMAKEKLKNKS